MKGYDSGFHGPNCKAVVHDLDNYAECNNSSGFTKTQLTVTM